MTQLSPLSTMLPVVPSRIGQDMAAKHPDRYSTDPAGLPATCPTCGKAQPLRCMGNFYSRSYCQPCLVARYTARDAQDTEQHKCEQARRLLHSAYTWLDHYSPALMADHRRVGHTTPPDRLEACTFANWQPVRFTDALQAAQTVARLVVTRRTWLRNLLFVGNPGTGKTHLMAAILHDVTSHGIPARFATAKTLFDLLYAVSLSDAEAVTHEIKKCPLLCLDELDKLHIKAGGGNFQRRTLQDVFDYRNRHRLPTVMTANEQHNFTPWLEESSLSRLFDCDGPDGGQTLIKMVGDDYRLLRASGVSLWPKERQ